MAPARVLAAASAMVSMVDARVDGSDYMDCRGAPLCGVITLESGQGTGYYHHKNASVHGLWPETSPYGSSQCIKPQDESNTTKIPSCYNTSEAMQDPQHQIEFVNHEWTKHGVCAGAKNVDDFFNQICSLTAGPVAVLEKAKESGATFDAMVQAVKQAGYPVFNSGGEDYQIDLSACAGRDGRWKIAATSDFASKCGGSPGPSPSPTPRPPSPPSPPSPSPTDKKCERDRRGPPCKSASDCTGLPGCIRCAHSGFCTAQPLGNSTMFV